MWVTDQFWCLLSSAATRAAITKPNRNRAIETTAGPSWYGGISALITFLAR